MFNLLNTLKIKEKETFKRDLSYSSYNLKSLLGYLPIQKALIKRAVCIGDACLAVYAFSAFVIEAIVTSPLDASKLMLGAASCVRTVPV